MEPKDYISIIAVVISAFSFALSYVTLRQKSAENKRTLRNQLSDTIMKLDSVFAEFDKLVFENSTEYHNPYFVGRRSFLNGQKRFLARQAVSFMNQIPNQVSDFEYNRVADAFSSIGDFEEGNEFYKRAVNAASTSYYKSINARAFARSLFNQGNTESGRKMFKIAIDLVKPDSDVKRFHTAETYQRWAIAEADSNNLDVAVDRINAAEKIYKEISNEQTRDRGLNNLKELQRIVSDRKQKAVTRDVTETLLEESK